MDIEQILEQIKKLPRKDEGEIYLSSLKPLIKNLGKDHHLAIRLWETKNKAAREIAVRIAEPEKTNEELLEKWVKDLNEWGLTDAFTGHLVKYTSFAVSKSYEWAEQEPEFIRRAGFATIAQMAWAKNDFDDTVFIKFLPLIDKMASDDRFYVKKAVNWALRDIGKRNPKLQKHAQQLKKKLQQSDNKTACWVGKHRCKEFMT